MDKDQLGTHLMGWDFDVDSYLLENMFVHLFAGHWLIMTALHHSISAYPDTVVVE